MLTAYSQQTPDKVIVPIMGFTERTRAETGIELMWRSWQLQRGDDRLWVMDPRRWCDDMRDVAALIHRNAAGAARILIVAYSWGVGVGAVRLARELGALGRDVWGLCSCDGVFRSDILPEWIPLNPLSLLSVIPIAVPDNVRRVHAIYQRTNYPRGLKPRCSSDTHLAAWEQVPQRHQDADEAELWRVIVSNAVRNLSEAPGESDPWHRSR